MRTIIHLTCLTCAGQSRRVQATHREEVLHNSWDKLLPLSSSPELAFNVVGLGERIPLGNARGMLVEFRAQRKAHMRARGRALRSQPRGQPHVRGRGCQGTSSSSTSTGEPDLQTAEEQEWASSLYHIGVIGAGPVGMTAAAIAKDRGYCVTVLEKQGDVGGDWRRWGNPWSKLQVHKDAYIIRSPSNIHVEGQDRLPLYPSRGQMLEYFQKYAQQTGLYQHMIFNATVTGRDGTRIFYQKDGVEKSLFFSHVFAAPGRVNTRREKKFDSEDKFQGRVAYGSGGDLIGFDWQAKHVVIVGHGSFALENARHALENGATQVILIARHEALVYPRVVSYALDNDYLQHVPDMLEAIHKMYRVIHYPFDELQRISQLPFMTMPPSSDVFFLAIAAGKLKVVRGEVAKLEEHSVVTNEGSEFPADVFIKCLGFKRDTKLDAELMEPGSGDIEEQWIMDFVDEDKTVYLGSCSNGENLVYPNSSPPETEAEIFFRDVDGNPHIWREPGQWQDPLDFLADVRKEWNDYCLLFDVNISYPYTEEDIKWAFSLD